MRNRFRCLITGLLVGGLLMCPISAGSVFPDVDDSAPYAEAVEHLNEAGIMKGSSSGNFNPNSTVTRAEMATILCNAVNEIDNIVPVGDIFTDVSKDHWASGYIARASTLGFISGYGDGRFGVNDEVTYEQAITMVIQASGGAGEAQERGGYPDGFVSLADDFGLLHGVDAKMGESLSRANVAVLIFNLLK